VGVAAARSVKDARVGTRRGRFAEAEVHSIENAPDYLQKDAHEQVVPVLLDFLRRT
jgi:hypothetical protein